MNYKNEIKYYRSNIGQEISDRDIILNYIDVLGNEILTRDSEIAHITCSSMIFNKSYDKVLMVHHNIYNTWAWTGGHADGNCNFREVAIKEAKEETGIKNVELCTDDIISIDILPVWGHIKNEKYVSSHLHLNITYALIADEEENLVYKADENSGVKWIGINEISDYSNEDYLIGVYNKIISKVKAIL